MIETNQIVNRFNDEDLQARIRRITENSDDIKNSLYNTEEEDEEEAKDLDRIEEGYKLLQRSFINTGRDPWSVSRAGHFSRKLISTHMNSMKNGLYSIYPIPCKRGACPYGSSCIALRNHMEPPYGEACVIETAKIERLIIDYSSQFKMESSSATDRTMIRELVQLELLMDRCQNLMAQECSPLQEVVAGIGEDGSPYTQPVVSKYFDAWERMSKRKQSLLNDLEGTRRSKRGKGNDEMDDAQIILTTLANNEDFMKVEERPEQFKDLDTSRLNE